MGERQYKVLVNKTVEKFIDSLPLAAQKKVAENIKRIKGGIMDSEIFKKLGDTGIWEIRTLSNKLTIRIFAFWDTRKEALIITTHGLLKKTQKTPPNEMKKAQQIRNKYFEIYK